METIVIDPLTRIEGHLKVKTKIENGVVAEATTSGEMFRGIEKALIGHDARTAQQITQRVCGVCPYAHADAASKALENAMGLTPNENGIRLKNLILGAYQLQDHLLHFYHLCALDFIDIAAVLQYNGSDATLNYLKGWVDQELKSTKIFPAAPFLPRYDGDYTKKNPVNFSAIKNYAAALPVMADLHKLVAIFGGKSPHPVAIEAGGVTTMPTVSNLAQYRSILNRVKHFISDNYLNDVLAVATAFDQYFLEGVGHGNMLSFPYFTDVNSGDPVFEGGATIAGNYQSLDIENIVEDLTYSYYRNDEDRQQKPLSTASLIPISYEEFKGEQKKEDGKYSWTKAPRYGNRPMEVGPAARLINTYHSGKNPELNQLIDATNKTLGINIGHYNSVMGRHLSRALISQVILKRLLEDVEKVEPNKSGFIEQQPPKNATGIGLTEASRGALAHWIKTDSKGYIENYELIVPTTWNISPKDASGTPGTIEQMLIGTKIKDSDNPIEVARIVRSADPCMACSIH